MKKNYITVEHITAVYQHHSRLIRGSWLFIACQCKETLIAFDLYTNVSHFQGVKRSCSTKINYTCSVEQLESNAENVHALSHACA